MAAREFEWEIKDDGQPSASPTLEHESTRQGTARVINKGEELCHYAARAHSTAEARLPDGTIIDPSEASDMVSMFQSILQEISADEAERCLQRLGWDLQRAVKEALSREPDRRLFDGQPLHAVSVEAGANTDDAQQDTGNQHGPGEPADDDFEKEVVDGFMHGTETIMRGGAQVEYEEKAAHRGKVRWGGLRVAGLCIGAGDYIDLTPLSNAVRDAVAFNEKLNAMPGCRSNVKKNPEDLPRLIKAIRGFLEDANMRADPPQVIVIYYAGHGIQEGGRVYLVPLNASREVVDDLDVECLSLDKLMQILRRDFDEHVRNKEMIAPVFIVVLDSCREGLPGADLRGAMACEPNKDAAPLKYTILLSCSRTTTASDGPRGGHSPCASALLDPQRGLFAEGVSVRDAIAHMSASLQELHGQTPMSIGPPECIPKDLFLLPASQASQATAPASSSPGQGKEVGAEMGEQVATHESMGEQVATHEPVDADVLDKLQEFDIEDAAAALAQHGFRKLRTLTRMEDRYAFITCVDDALPCI